MFLLFLRTLIVYIAVISGLRFTGKRQLGELSTSEFAVTMLVSELATIPLQDPAIPLLGGIFPLITLLTVEVLISYLCHYNRRARQLLCGNSCIVIKDGQFDINMLRLLRLSPDDILEALRISGISQIKDVRYAIVETNGQLSVIPYADRQPLTPSDIKLSPDEIGIPLILVSNGKIIDKNLHRLNKTKHWIAVQCKKQGISSLQDVFLLTLDDCGNIFIQAKSTGGTT